MLGDMKLREKSSVLRHCLKISSAGVERAVDGKLFHARAAATLLLLVLLLAKNNLYFCKCSNHNLINLNKIFHY